VTGLAVASTLGLALLMGVSLGLLGGGGAILAVPILTGVVGVEPRAAIASSLPLGRILLLGAAVGSGA
jgi:uncharacterized protein